MAVCWHDPRGKCQCHMLFAHWNSQGQWPWAVRIHTAHSQPHWYGGYVRENRGIIALECTTGDCSEIGADSRALTLMVVSPRSLWQNPLDVSCGFLLCLDNKYFTTMRHQLHLNQLVIGVFLYIFNPETWVIIHVEGNPSLSKNARFFSWADFTN